MNKKELEAENTRLQDALDEVHQQLQRVQQVLREALDLDEEEDEEEE